MGNGGMGKRGDGRIEEWETMRWEDGEEGWWLGRVNRTMG